MGYASRSGRAQTSARNPRAFGVCDRCGMWYNHDRLRWQFDWRGASIQNIRILVCDHCYDTPQQQLRAIVVPGDPTPILNARVEAFIQDETNYRQSQIASTNVPIWTNNLNAGTYWANNSGDYIPWTGVYNQAYVNTVDPNTGIRVPNGQTRTTQINDPRVTQQTGEAPGGRNQLPGTDWNVPAVIYDGTEIGLPYNNAEVPFTGPLSPPYNYVVQWNNQWNFGILTGSYWSNSVDAFVNWTTTTL